MKALLALVVLLASLGCVSSTFVRLGEQQFAPRAEDHPIVVYDTTDDVKRPFVKIARIWADGGDFTSFDWLTVVLERRARQAGGDAIVLQSAQRWIAGYDDACIPEYTHRMTALVLRFTERE